MAQYRMNIPKMGAGDVGRVRRTSAQVARFMRERRRSQLGTAPSIESATPRTVLPRSDALRAYLNRQTGEAVITNRPQTKLKALSRGLLPVTQPQRGKKRYGIWRPDGSAMMTDRLDLVEEARAKGWKVKEY